MTEGFVEIVTLVKAAHMPAASERTILWCIEQLPTLYEDFARTYETRFSDKIGRLEKGMLGALTEESKSGPDANRLATVIMSRLRVIHACHGLQSLDPKPPKETVAPRKAHKAVR